MQPSMSPSVCSPRSYAGEAAAFSFSPELTFFDSTLPNQQQIKHSQQIISPFQQIKFQQLQQMHSNIYQPQQAHIQQTSLPRQKFVPQSQLAPRFIAPLSPQRMPVVQSSTPFNQQQLLLQHQLKFAAISQASGVASQSHEQQSASSPISPLLPCRQLPQTSPAQSSLDKLTESPQHEPPSDQSSRLDPVIYSMGSDFHQAFLFPSTSIASVCLRQDLLHATDKVTSAMSTLVNELNMGLLEGLFESSK
ncbi:hypothetical protein HELRODRAFT_158751 [Helobdella robusta]|uniref:Uncharacterized protein n=1 Tax=Helobdella robusta TaxID=6412 RepID=T1EN73_HELRO|nr:hypothetical protein HELRODRAFT_158751 [Helobdella robusta]ESO12270.1 hypothetical protein HELRODRAFT_158751 [Helobdella robusta]